MSSKKAAKRLVRESKPVRAPPPDPDDDSDADDKDAMPVAHTNCSMCIGVCTTRRCSQCGVCVLCSAACESRYAFRCHGRAACRFHNALTQHGVGPMQLGPERVAMCPTIDNVSPGQALVHGTKWLLGYLALNPDAPLHEGTVVGLAVSAVGANRYVIGGKRSLNMQFSSEGTNAMLVQVTLLRLGQLATAQQLDDNPHSPGDALGAQTFLIGAIIKHPLTLRHVLQLDLVIMPGARLVDPALLSCSRTSALVLRQVHNEPYFCQALRPIQHKQEKGLLAFDVGGRPDPESLSGLTPLLSNAQIVQTLCMPEPEPASASASASTSGLASGLASAPAPA